MKLTTNEIQKRYRLRKKGYHIEKKSRNAIKGCVKKEWSCSACSIKFVAYDRSDEDPKKSKNRYCSRTCYYTSKIGEKNSNYKGDRPCKCCGKHVMGKQRIFCNRECYSKYYKDNHESRQLTVRLNRNMRRAIIRYLKKGSKSGRQWTSLAGYGVEELKNHLQSKFESWMNWDNYGTKWHIDHIKPVATFNFSHYSDPDFFKCWSLDNLQPLCAKQNLRKGSFYNGKRYHRNR